MFFYDKDLGVLNGIRLDIDPTPPVFSWDTFSREGLRRSITISVDQDCEYGKGFTKIIINTDSATRQISSQKSLKITELDSSGECMYQLKSTTWVMVYEPLDKDWHTKVDMSFCQWEYVYSILQHEIEKTMRYRCVRR